MWKVKYMLNWILGKHGNDVVVHRAWMVKQGLKVFFPALEDSLIALQKGSAISCHYRRSIESTGAIDASCCLKEIVRHVPVSNTLDLFSFGSPPLILRADLWPLIDGTSSLMP